MPLNRAENSDDVVLDVAVESWTVGIMPREARCRSPVARFCADGTSAYFSIPALQPTSVDSAVESHSIRLAIEVEQRSTLSGHTSTG